MHHVTTAGRAGRLIGPWILASAVALGVTGCADDGGSAPDSSSSSTADAKRAETALDAGLTAHADGDLTTAAEKYEETLNLDPDNKFAFYNLALIDEASGNYGLAEEKYRESLKSDPAYEPALFNLAILRTSSDPKEAISLYEKAVAANKKDASAWLNLGLLLRASEEKAAGDKAVAKAISLNPDLIDPAE